MKLTHWARGRADSPLLRFYKRHGPLGILSGEFFLDDRANGGKVIAWRTMLTTSLTYLATLVVYERLAQHATWQPSLPHADTLRATFPWLGVIAAAMYTGFYSRFASQWTYLAGLYNQIMAAAAVQPAPGPIESNKVLAAWRAGFIEDAEDLHLATKPSYAGVITSFLEMDGVRDAYVRNTVGGAIRLANLERRCRGVLGK
jgi:hypothetical protein